jgi:hypothetical protein
LNLASHKLMRPEFLSLGYPEGRFVGPGKPLDEKGEKVVADLEQMNLQTRNLMLRTCPIIFGVGTSVSTALSGWGRVSLGGGNQPSALVALEILNPGAGIENDDALVGGDLP